MQPAELEQVPLNQQLRRDLLNAYETYYALHVPDFGRMRTLPVLREILGS
jgi:DNA repair protein RecO (recombination protein O)